MKARLIFHDKGLLADGSIVEMIVRQLLGVLIADFLGDVETVRRSME